MNSPLAFLNVTGMQFQKENLSEGDACFCLILKVKLLNSICTDGCPSKLYLLLSSERFF